jgi:crotonobetainyl-CoA:carnitine CoA-transferase CaiB-like acyl-CoA transferase
MLEGIRTVHADLKTAAGQKLLHQELAKTDVLITSFRPSALLKLGVGWKTLHARYPALSAVEIVGEAGMRAEIPGHDLTYLAQCGLVAGLELPTTLYADMAGSLMACEAVLCARLHQLHKGRGTRLQVALSEGAQYLALPRTWGLTLSNGAVGGAHAGYQVYNCMDGRVAVAALEARFANALFESAGIKVESMQELFLPSTRERMAAFLARRTRRELDKLALKRDLPLLTMPP